MLDVSAGIGTQSLPLASSGFQVVRTVATHYAIPLSRLLELLEDSGFAARVVTEVRFYQPILMGRHTPE